MTLRALAPLRDDPLLEGDRTSLPAQTFFEGVDACLTALMGIDKPISNTDSPFQANIGDCLLVDMSAGDVAIDFPSDGWFKVSRKGDPNDLTLNETVSGDVNPLILFDKSTANLSKFGGEWRYV